MKLKIIAVITIAIGVFYLSVCQSNESKFKQSDVGKHFNIEKWAEAVQESGGMCAFQGMPQENETHPNWSAWGDPEWHALCPGRYAFVQWRYEAGTHRAIMRVVFEVKDQ